MAHEMFSRFGAVLIGVIVAAALWGGAPRPPTSSLLAFLQIIQLLALKSCFITKRFLETAS